jgi:hypothetical protein
VTRRWKRIVGDEHLISRTDAQSQQREMQSGRAIVDGDGVINATSFCETLLETPGTGTLAGYPA